jgi:hypothetical protein
MQLHEMEIRLTRGRHPPEIERYFDPTSMDPFYNDEVLTALNGSDWHSVLITSGRNAFFHTFAKQRINKSDMFDIEPRLGYAGPVLKGDDPDFANAALARYSHLCRSENVVAELVRFNPLLRNHLYFVDTPLIDVSPAKEIVVAQCRADDASQLAEFSEPCRRRVRRGSRDCSYRRLTDSDEIRSFKALYYESLQRVSASPSWYIEDELFKRMLSSELYTLYGVFSDSQLVSTCLTVEAGTIAYYLLAANSDPHTRGANEFLIHSVARDCSNRGIRHFILGGGSTSSSEDTLLRFKRKFTKHTDTFFIGKIVHDKEAFDTLSARHTPQPGMFLSYRTPSPMRAELQCHST